VHDSGLRGGTWRHLTCTGLPDDPSHRDLVAGCWTADQARHLVIVNLLDRPAQARIPLPRDDLGARTWTLRDLLTGQSYQRDGTEMRDPGLYVALAGWAANIFTIEPADDS
jgi:hypothetical protein